MKIHSFITVIPIRTENRRIDVAASDDNTLVTLEGLRVKMQECKKENLIPERHAHF